MPKCKGVCSRYKADNPMKMVSRYAYAKRCQTCDTWIKRIFAKCPCCKGKLKSNPKYAKARERLVRNV